MCWCFPNEPDSLLLNEKVYIFSVIEVFNWNEDFWDRHTSARTHYHDFRTFSSLFFFYDVECALKLQKVHVVLKVFTIHCGHNIASAPIEEWYLVLSEPPISEFKLRKGSLSHQATCETRLRHHLCVVNIRYKQMAAWIIGIWWLALFLVWLRLCGLWLLKADNWMNDCFPSLLWNMTGHDVAVNLKLLQLKEFLDLLRDILD